MAGASPAHNLISWNIAMALGPQVRSRGCFGFPSAGRDQRASTPELSPPNGFFRLYQCVLISFCRRTFDPIDLLVDMVQNIGVQRLLEDCLPPQKQSREDLVTV